MVAPPKSSPACFSNPRFIFGEIWYYSVFSWCRKASRRACWWCSCKSAVVELLFLQRFIKYKTFTWNNWFYMNKTSDYFCFFVVWIFYWFFVPSLSSELWDCQLIDDYFCLFWTKDLWSKCKCTFCCIFAIESHIHFVEFLLLCNIIRKTVNMCKFLGSWNIFCHICTFFF